jgi:Flp pilus assembly pilin Flp
MKLCRLYKTFREDESGAVTVDWVVLTAAIVGLAIAIGSVIFNRAGNIATLIDGELQGVTVTSTLGGGGGDGGGEPN